MEWFWEFQKRELENSKAAVCAVILQGGKISWALMGFNRVYSLEIKDNSKNKILNNNNNPNNKILEHSAENPFHSNQITLMLFLHTN